MLHLMRNPSPPTYQYGSDRERYHMVDLCEWEGVGGRGSSGGEGRGEVGEGGGEIRGERGKKGREKVKRGRVRG